MLRMPHACKVFIRVLTPSLTLSNNMEDQVLKERLLEILICKPKKRPGRFSPTFERICEVLEVTLPPIHAKEIIAEMQEHCRKSGFPLSNRRPINTRQAEDIFDIIVKRLTKKEIILNLSKKSSLSLTTLR